MKPLVLSLALAGALALTGCSSLVSLNSFVTAEQAVMDPAMLGTWVNADGKEIYWIRQDGSGYTIRYVTETSDPYQFKARLMVAGDVRLVDLVDAKEEGLLMTVHTPVRIWLQDNTLRIAFLQTDWLREQVGKQLTTVLASDRTVVTAPGDAVRSFLAKAGADPKASDEPEVLHRVQ